jgi:hypothetical protein
MLRNRLEREARRPPCDGLRIDSHDDPDDEGVWGRLAAIEFWYRE